MRCLDHESLKRLETRIFKWLGYILIEFTEEAVALVIEQGCTVPDAKPLGIRP